MTPGTAVARRVAALVAGALLTCGTALPAAAVPQHLAAGRVPLRVMSYNIHHGAGTDGRFELARTAVAIRATGADVVGLQEVDSHWGERSHWREEASVLGRMLGMHCYFAAIYDLAPPTSDGPERRYGVALLSRYPIVRAENHSITRLSSQDPNPVPRPMPGFAEVVVNVHDARVHVYDTHLDFRADPSGRARQVRDMRAIMAEDAGKQRVLVGDFNAPPAAPELGPLWVDLRDALTVAGRRDTPTYPTYPAALPDKRLDYVTVSPGLTVDGARVPGSPLHRVASDHRPVVANLSVTTGR